MRDTHLRQSRVRLIHGRRRAGRLSAVNVAYALFGVVAFAVAAGYLAGVAFRPSPKAIPATIPQIGLYATVETRPPQTAATPTPSSVPPTSQQPASQSPERAPFSAGQPLAAPSTANAVTGSLATARRFHVEIGTYQNPVEAEAVARDLRRRGYAVHVGQGPPYGVRVGGLLDRPTAERLVRLLAAAGFDAALTAR